MKFVFYTAALSEPTFTPSDAIIYSQMLYRCIMDGGAETFSQDDGKIDWQKCCLENGGYLPLSDSAQYDWHKHLSMTDRQFRRSKVKLRKENYIVGDAIRVINGVDSNFFELQVGHELSGFRLIAYSYLYNKTKHFGWINKFHKSISADLGMGKEGRAFQYALADLRKLGLVEVKHKGKQTLLRAI